MSLGGYRNSLEKPDCIAQVDFRMGQVGKNAGYASIVRTPINLEDIGALAAIRDRGLQVPETPSLLATNISLSQL